VAIISAIEPQKSTQLKKNKRFNVFVDQKYAFSVSEENLLRYKLKPGLTLDEKEIKNITNDEFFKKLLDNCINFLSFRPRTEKEISDFIVKKISIKQEIPFNQAKESQIIPLVIKRLKKYKYINDKDFVAWWIKSRNESKQKGIKLIKLELRQKGIAKELLDKIVSNDSDQEALALIALEKKKSKWQRTDPKKLKTKVLYYLGSRGFDTDTIKRVFAIYFKKVIKS
jgi:regulatory protein